MLAVWKKELRNYFLSPVGYIFSGFFLLLLGIFFALGNLFSASSDYNGMLQTSTFIFMILVPVLTMRLLAEESRQKTDQLLFTSPLSIAEIVTGKYLAATTVFLLTMLITCIYPVIMNIYGIIPVWQIVGGYIGFFLLGACFIAIGLFISSLTDNQVSAAVITFSAFLFVWIIDGITQSLPNDTFSGIVFVALIVLGITFFLFRNTKNLIITVASGLLGIAIMLVLFSVNPLFYDGVILKVLDWFSLLKRYANFAQGNLGLNLIVYYLSFITAFVYLTIRVIEKRRWN